mmetsp:Transcript_91666/g.163145  ORF Transcript_91666/g.163145 Transcript_91666/m.163145 type:complete len:295 (+) Transcript_91666:35-919(+)
MAEQIVNAFRFHDKAETGICEVSVLRNVIKAIDFQVYSECEATGVFGADNSGYIDYLTFVAWATGKYDEQDFFYTEEEFDAALELEIKAGKEEEFMREAKAKFEEIDKDKSGILDWEEMKVLCTFMFEKFGRVFKSTEEKDFAISKQLQRFQKVAPRQKGWDFPTFQAYYQKLIEDTEKFNVQKNDGYAQGYVKSEAAKKFAELDKDGSNSLSGEELETFAAWVHEQFHPEGKSLSPQERKKEAKKLLSRIDTKKGNNDGSVSFAEFDIYFEQKLVQIEEFKRRGVEKKQKKKA